MENEKILLNVEETATYLNLGKTKTRELMKENEKLCQSINEMIAELKESGWLLECFDTEEAKAVERGIV